MISIKICLLLVTTAACINTSCGYYVDFEVGKIYKFYVKFYEVFMYYPSGVVYHTESLNGNLTVEKINDWHIFQFKNLTVNGLLHKNEFQNRFRVKLRNNKLIEFESMADEFQKTLTVKRDFIKGMFNKYDEVIALAQAENIDKEMEVQLPLVGFCNSTVQRSEKADRLHLKVSMSLHDCTILQELWDLLADGVEMLSNKGSHSMTIDFDKATHKIVLLKTYLKINLKEENFHFTYVHKEHFEYLGESDAH